MRELLFFVASSFWAGAAHAATPGHGKTIAAAYIVGARGKPIDALILGIFVTLSHTSGIVLVGVLASLGSTWLRPQRIEAYLAVAVGIVVIVLGLWMLWAQRDLVALAMGEAGTSRADAHARDHGHDQAHDHPHVDGHSEPVVWHSHGFGKVHAHRLDVVAENRPKLPVLLALVLRAACSPIQPRWRCCSARCRAEKSCSAWSLSWCSASASRRRWWWSASLPRRSAKRCSTGWPASG